MKKILFVSANDWMPWGGSEELWTKTALLISQKGYKVMVSVKGWDQTPVGIQNLELAGIDVRKRYRYRYSLGERFAAKLGIAALKSPYDVLIEKPDLVVINQGDIADGCDWGRRCRFLNISYVIISHLVHDKRLLTDTDIDTVVNLYAGAKKTFFVSKNNHFLFEKITGTRINNASIIQNPYKQINSLPAYPSYEKGYHLAFVAQLNAFHKGHDILFEVLDQFKWRERNLHIHLYGEGINEKYLRRLAELKNLKSIYFEGYQPIENIWSLNHGLILCSRMEGQSLALIEAMYCSRMAIVTKVGNADELIEDGITGYLARYPISEYIDDALERAWQNRDNWMNIGCAAANRIRHSISNDPVELFAETLCQFI